MAAVSGSPSSITPSSFSPKWPSPAHVCPRRRQVSTPSPKSESRRLSQSRSPSSPSPPTPSTPIPDADLIKVADDAMNLSTRRGVSAESHGKLTASNDTASPPPVTQLRPKSLRVRGIAPPRSSGEEERVKMVIPQVSVSLSLEEIEEDVWAFTGSRLSRRPRKRARHVQRKLDQSFPGLWLSKITIDRYRIPDHFDSTKEVENARRFLKLR